MKIYERLMYKYEKRKYIAVSNKIYMTPPLILNGDCPLIVTQLCHRDVASYLVAIKSFYYRIQKGKVAVINDGSLTDEDLINLNQHIPGIEIINIATISTRSCPKGGTWERLVKIIELTNQTYVIQIDADTLTSGPISEIRECIDSNKSFILGTNSGTEVTPAPQTSSIVKTWLDKPNPPRKTVGLLSELSLELLESSENRMYVHGSSGFAGFSKHGFNMNNLINFSNEMSKIIGDKWSEWGSEQIASNYMLANAENTTVLPIESYACQEPHMPAAERVFIHFIGSYRFSNSTYRLKTAEIIERLNVN